MKKPLKDPHGGLTAAGRAMYLKKDGAHLKPGVKKKGSEMSKEDMKRKGSWAVRFYGRKGKLPPLLDEKGTADSIRFNRCRVGRASAKNNQRRQEDRGQRQKTFATAK